MRSKLSKFFIVYCILLTAYVIFGLGSFNLNILKPTETSTAEIKVDPKSNNVILQLEYDPSQKENRDKNSNPPEEVRESIGTKRYDLKIKGIEQTRLGFSVLPEFKILPKSWQNILSQRKGQILKELNLSQGQGQGQGQGRESEGKGRGKGQEITNKSVQNSSSTPSPSKIESAAVEIITVEPKKILIYDSFEWWRFNESTSCPQNPEFKCHFIDRPVKKVLSESTVQEFGGNVDAIIMVRDFAHTEKIRLEGIYNSGKSGGEEGGKEKVVPVPTRIYFALESPYPGNNFQMRAKSRNTDGSGIDRDYLASYWRGSDIYAPYFAWQYFDRRVTSKTQERNYAEGRTKTAAIVVSNCYAHNDRMGLVQELQKYIKVDVFGHCGELECRRTDCFSNIKKNYKFYLSFENSNCRDYITEKIHKNAFENDLLPVVLGAHPSDYEAIAPAHSYIHVEDFASIEKLGLYLQRLDQDDSLYNSYFAWKGTGDFVSRNFMCEVCSFLHTENSKEVKTFDSNFVVDPDSNQNAVTYFNRKDTYNFETFKWHNRDERLCLSNNEWYWNK